ncbi:hypothetical protein WS67_03920 [Burkholderia singularis]|uniref:Uncharacterized protein n=1 Tax=Burkholderia singularis TaxID=1503053 RepID=A0A103E7W4_9BURK|nr:hypothetical protein WS67_03920 [Burkholderia singularis]
MGCRADRTPDPAFMNEPGRYAAPCSAVNEPRQRVRRRETAFVDGHAISLHRATARMLPLLPIERRVAGPVLANRAKRRLANTRRAAQRL